MARTFKKRSFRRRRVYRRKSKFNARVRKVTKRVLRAAAENKVQYASINNTVDANVGFIQPLVPAVNQGAGYTQRIGTEIQVKSMQFYGYFRLRAGSSTGPWLVSKVRVAFIGLKQVPTSITLNALLEDSPTTDTNDIDSGWDREFVTVYSDKHYLVGNTTTAYAQSGFRNTVQIRFKHKWLKKWRYQANANDVASDPTKFIYLCIWTDQSAAGFYQLDLFGSHKINFMDL